jgi:predicted phosphodiesterase
VVLHGHTHVPRDETIDGVRWLNPGSASQPRGGSAAGFAWLTIGRSGRVRWELWRA